MVTIVAQQITGMILTITRITAMRTGMGEFPHNTTWWVVSRWLTCLIVAAVCLSHDAHMEESRLAPDDHPHAHGDHKDETSHGAVKKSYGHDGHIESGHLCGGHE
jgi:hypothetical protein